MAAASTKTVPAWPIYVLSLPDATKRRARMSSQMSALDLSFEFIDAIDGRLGLPGQYEADIDRSKAAARHGRPLTDAEFACALSHQMIYAKLLKDGHAGAIILEDDAVIGPEFKKFLTTRSYSETGLLQLHYFNCWIWPKQQTSLFGGVVRNKVATDSLGTCAYSLTAKVARDLRARSLPISATADWPCDMARVDHWVTVPRIVQADDQATQSTLTKHRKKAREAVSGLAWWRFRALRFVSLRYWRRWVIKRRSTRIA